MQTGVISFCDRIAYNIKSVNVKEEILKDLDTRYGLKIIQKQWHRFDEESSIHITRSPHSVCIRSNGNPYFMVFSRYEDVPTIFFIDKKIHPNYHVPRIILGRGQFDESVFDNTVLDGEMVKDSSGQWIFLINDLMGHGNRSLINMPHPKRIEKAYEIFKNQYVADPVCDFCIFQIKRFFPCTQDSMREIDALTKTLPYTNRGIYFWPHNMKYKPKLHNFDDSLIKTVIRKVKDVPDFVERREVHERVVAVAVPPRSSAPFNVNAQLGGSSSSSSIGGNCTTRPMLLKKTGESDVYDVFETQNEKSIGIAYVPTMAVSRMLRSEFKDVTIAVYKQFVCEYNKQFNKWTPLRIHLQM